MSNKRKIEVLKIAILALENNLFPYTWTQASQCNCALLWCASNNSSPAVLKHEIARCTVDSDLPANANWEQIISHNCTLTGQPVDRLLAKLVQDGFTPSELRMLEGLADPSIVKRMLAHGYTVKRTVKRKWWRVWEPHTTTVTEPVTSDNFDYKSASFVLEYMRQWVLMLQEADKPVVSVEAGRAAKFKKRRGTDLPTLFGDPDKN